MTYEFDRESLIVACNRVEDSARELIEKHPTKMSAVEIISIERLRDSIDHFIFNFRRVPDAAVGGIKS